MAVGEGNDEVQTETGPVEDVPVNDNSTDPEEIPHGEAAAAVEPLDPLLLQETIEQLPVQDSAIENETEKNVETQEVEKEPSKPVECMCTYFLSFIM